MSYLLADEAQFGMRVNHAFYEFSKWKKDTSKLMGLGR